MPERPDIQQAIDALNAAFAADPEAIEALLLHEVPCNEALEAHPTVQVGGPVGNATVRAMGLLNGAIEPLTGRRIAFQQDEETGRVIGFQVFEPRTPDSDGLAEDRDNG